MKVMWGSIEVIRCGYVPSAASDAKKLFRQPPQISTNQRHFAVGATLLVEGRQNMIALWMGFANNLARLACH
jgi:hypothetical protein